MGKTLLTRQNKKRENKEIIRRKRERKGVIRDS
jgi:hypothetical protein